jgi:ADP-dependent NAD(P)H-hydrate dehydratase / NAD(P)H-hydrate epimerase
MLDPLYTAEEMKAAEAGHDVGELMARAGRAVAEHAMRRFPDARRFVAVCGKGANGGDGRIAIEVLEEAGRAARPVEEAPLEDADVIVDALFGTGFRGEPREEAARQIQEINAAKAPVVSVDLPSGVDASTGEVAGACVDADLTVTFHGPKVGLEVAPGRFHAGEVVVADIGLEPLGTEHALVMPAILAEIPRRQASQNKYTAGTVLVVGGSRGLTGAPSLAAEAAFRADAGYVAVAVPDSTLAVFEQRLLETVKLACPEEDGKISPRAVDPIAEFASRAGSLALGPGLGRGSGPKEVVRRLLEEVQRPAVVDADALNDQDTVDRADSARGRAVPTAGRAGGLGGGPPARGRAAGSRELRLHLRAERGGHAHRRPRRGSPRFVSRHPGAGDCGQWRRAHRHRCRVPRQGPRGAPGRGGRCHGAAARLEPDPAVGRDRERRHRRPAAGTGCTDLS